VPDTRPVINAIANFSLISLAETDAIIVDSSLYHLYKCNFCSPAVGMRLVCVCVCVCVRACVRACMRVCVPTHLPIYLTVFVHVNEILNGKNSLYVRSKSSILNFRTSRPEEVGRASSVYDVKLHNEALFYMLRLV